MYKRLFLRDDKHEEPYEGRLSRTVLWERKGEIPLRDPIRRKRANSQFWVTKIKK
jgi:hypothetical protein